jgi:dihydropyrimidine dehydrogenase (NADP+)
VEAVNDSKTAAWSIHLYLQKEGKDDEERSRIATLPAALPLFCTAVDNVDLSVQVCGVPFIHPFGLSSATPTGSIGQIKRAFEMGWSFAVTKTACRVPATNVSPRITRVPSAARCPSHVEAFQNIELITE